MSLLGRRSSAGKKVVLLTDGQSTVDKALTIPNAQKLKNIGVDVYVMEQHSIRRKSKKWQEMAYPPGYNVFRVTTNSDLVYVFKVISSILKNTHLPAIVQFFLLNCLLNIINVITITNCNNSLK